MEDAVIVSAVRTPVGSFGGQFKDVTATELGARAVGAALERAEIAREEVDEVVLGCVLTAGLGQNPARQVAIRAGIPKEVPATTINMVCGSGLKAVAIASQMIRAGDVDIVVAGGMENMTRAPYLIPSGRFGARMGDAELIDSMVHDGLWDAFNDIHMGITAENLAEQYGISREEQDAFAAASQQKAERAVAEGIFDDEIVSIDVPAKGGTRTVDSDEAPRAGTTPDTLAKLRTAFRRDGGTVTAGNASGINDGAAAIVVMSASKAAERGLQHVWNSRELRLRWGRAEDHGDRPRARGAQGAGPSRARSSATSTYSSSTRRSRHSRSPCSGSSTSTPSGSTQMAERSRWGTQSAPAAVGSSSPCCTRCAAATQGAASRRSASEAVKARRRSSATAPATRGEPTTW